MRILARLLLTLLFAAGLLPGAAPGLAAEKLGVVLLHGKNPGSPQNPGLQSLRVKLEHDGAKVRVPDMPWSARRYIDGDWTKAMDEIAANIAALKQDGASRIVLAGHSIGAAGALSFAATRGGVAAVAMLAPGHVPFYYYTSKQGPNVAVSASIDEARALVAAGQGDERRDFKDNNQGKALSVRLTAKQYLSYFDPEGDAEMGRMAGKLSPAIPVLVVLGDQDPLTKVGRSYIFDRLPANPEHLYLDVAGTHLSILQDQRDAIAAWIAKVAAR